MEHRSNSRAILLGCTALASMTMLSGQALAQTAANSSGGLEEIVVTAQKREQSVQDVPIAVTAVTQDTLQANRITTVNDLGSIAPGVTVRPSPGAIGVPAFTIRGQISFGSVGGSDKQVSLYLDGVYISNARGSIFDLPDVERLEVLRGPQGTLFGRNATAGAVSIITREPNGKFGVRTQFTYGNYDQFRVRASVDLPQVGPFSAYVSFLHNYKRGDIRNAGAGTVWDRSLSPGGFGKSVSPKYLGTIDSDSYFAAVKFEPSDSFKTVYKFDRNDDSGTPDGNALTSYNPAFPGLGAGAGLIAPILNALYTSQNIYLNPSFRRPDVVTNSWATPRVQRVFGHSLTSTWQASDNITVKNVAAYRQSRVFATAPIDGVSGLVFTQQALVPFATLSAISTLGAGFFALTPAQQGATIGQFAAGLQPFVGGRMLLTASQASSLSKQWSDELQVNYTSDRIKVTLGALWFHAKDDQGGPDGMAGSLSLTLPPLPASGLVPLGNQGRYFNKATSYAAFGQAEFKFTDQLELVAGARVTHDEKTSIFHWDRIINGTVVPQPDIIPAAYKKTKPNYLVGLNWKPNNATLIYAKYSTSFVSGGSIAGITYVPETAKSWELGLKADFLNHRLRTNLALFHVDYKNFQSPASAIDPQAVAGLTALYGSLAQNLASSLSTFVQQATDIRSKGFELEVTAAPAAGLVTGGSLAYADTNFRNINPAFLASQGGEFTPSIRPKWTGSLFGSYETRPLFGDATLYFRADGLYQSEMALSTRPNYSVTVLGIPADAIRSPAHWTVNARLALRHIQVGPADAEFAVWAKNMTNSNYQNSIIALPWGTSATYDPARTFGIDLELKF